MSQVAAAVRIDQIDAMLAALQGGPLTAAQPSGVAGATGSAPGAQSFASVLQATGSGPAASAGGPPTRFDGLIDAAARRHGIPPALLKGLIQQESDFNPTSSSGAGAQGLCQLMPATARALGCTNPSDPAQNIEAGAKYLRQQLDAFGGDAVKALAAYNAGPGAVQRYGGVPPYAETQDYVRKVLGYARRYGYTSTTPVSA